MDRPIRVDALQRARLRGGDREAAGRRRSSALVHGGCSTRSQSSTTCCGSRARPRRRRDDLFLLRFRERGPDGSTRRCRARDAAYYRPGGVYRDPPEKMPRFTLDRKRRGGRSMPTARDRPRFPKTSRPLPLGVDETTRLLTRTASGSSAGGIGVCRPSAPPSFGPMPARLASRGTCARSSPTRSTMLGLRHPDRHQRRLTTATCARAGDARTDHRAMRIGPQELRDR